MKKTIQIFTQILPILIMIGLIPIVQNDWKLTFLFLGIILIDFLLIKSQKTDLLLFLFGLLGMFFSECLFINTGVEVFLRNSLFGLMPLWLPFLWACGFVVIGRSVEILKN